MRVLYEAPPFMSGCRGGVIRLFVELVRRLSEQPDFVALWKSFVPDDSAGRVLRAWDKWRGLQLYHPLWYPDKNPAPRVPAVVHVYDLVHEKIPRADSVRHVDRLLANKRRWIEQAAHIICISRSTRDEVMQHYAPPTDRVSVIYPGCSTAFVRLDDDESARRLREQRPDAARPFLLYVGSRAQYKNFHRLAAAYRRWPGCRDVDLVVVGAPRDERDEAAIDLAGGAAGIHFVGPVDDAVLCALYNRARALVYPALIEGFGLPVVEAQACGCPVVLSDIPVHREVADGVNGGLVFAAPSSVDALRAGLEVIPARSEAAPLPPRFSWAANTAETRRLYDTLAARS